jgi:hypothetical protein
VGDIPTATIQIEAMESGIAAAFRSFDASGNHVAMIVFEGASKLDANRVAELIIAALGESRVARLALVRDEIATHFVSSTVNLKLPGKQARAFKNQAVASTWLKPAV